MGTDIEMQKYTNIGMHNYIVSSDVYSQYLKTFGTTFLFPLLMGQISLV
jgi:hypothetical protein